MVDFELYRIFKIVADEENITKASKRMNISQPAITKHIKHLEDLLDFKLFERTNTGMTLTQNGRKIYEEIKEPVTILQNIYKKYSNSREIYLGIHAAMLNKEFNEQLMAYINNENQTINVMNYNTDEMLTKLETQKIDIAISKKYLYYNNPKIEFIKLGILHDILIIKPDTDLSNKILTLNELKEKNIYLPREHSVTTLNFFNSLKLNESNFKNIRNISYITMLNTIKNSTGIGLITKEYIKKELQNKDVVEIKTEFDISPIEYGIYINKENMFKELKEFINLIKENIS